MRGLYWILALISVIFVACTTDAGYDPRPQYADKNVDYIVDGFWGSVSRDDSYLPKCTDSLDGKLFYMVSNALVYACIDKDWTEIRSLPSTAPELEGLPYYDPDARQTVPANRIDYSTSSFVDSRDGRTYKTVIVGGLEWMAENLDYDGGNNTTYDDCVNLLGAKNCRLYTRYYMVGGPGSTLDSICPAGFKLPYMDQYKDLWDIVGGYVVAGKALKSKTFVGDKNRKGEDVIGFNALPTGFKDNIAYREAGSAAAFMTVDGYIMWVSGDDDHAYYTNYQSGEYYSVRCVRSAR
ncbi:FISUMP domain-containing protein [Fibrobacter sp. UWEL]|uniref:FISUMP domain-containing protein n=1 Tax=Fibrobacter sp. UWEL TaxID=1896209 RepID=UPI0009216F09|nr:FISUMP domain-containing protein [Fibrobacter sp. UWEL]SHK44445.1 major paralogous domain-containing protein [Fibrobacter sp. UWEL]